jgi:hypothetical protein
MAGRAFKGWGLLLNSFNRGFNPGSFVSGAERGTANAQRQDDIARAGAQRQEDIRRQTERDRRNANDRMAGQLASTPEDWSAVYESGWRPGNEIGEGFLGAVKKSKAAAKEAAKEAAKKAAQTRIDAADAKQRSQEEVARIGAAASMRNAALRKRVALGDHLLRVTGGDMEKAEHMRRTLPEYARALFPGDRRGGWVGQQVDLGNASTLQHFQGRLRAMGLEGFTQEHPVVDRLLKQYSARVGSLPQLRIGDDIREAIAALKEREPATGSALEAIVAEMADDGRVVVMGGTP